MEEIKIFNWLKNNSCYGYGYGYGYGSCYGYGYGDGSGDGYGYGDGSGDGYGYGYGYGDGDGDGSGDGYGYGYGDGSGDGYGDGYGDGSGISKFKGFTVHKIDKIQTIITQIKGSFAKGYILNKDFTLTDCYIAKGQGYFAHGVTIKEAYKALQDKILENMDIEEKIDRVCEEYEKDVKYPTKRFYELHHILTGSCEMGRNQFVKEHDIDLNGEMTVDEFIELTINDFGSESIKMLKERWEDAKG